jgi:hypothetical protein
MFHIKSGLKQGDVLSSFLFNFALEYAISRADANQKGLKLDGRHLLLVNTGDVNVLGGSVQAI